MVKARADVSAVASDVHAQIRETVDAIDAHWAARKGITFEQERATQEAHEAKVLELEDKLSTLGRQLPTGQATYRDLESFALVARNWFSHAPVSGSYPHESYHDGEDTTITHVVWAAKLIRAVMQMAAQQPTHHRVIASARTVSAVKSRDRKFSVAFPHLPGEEFTCDPTEALKSGDTVVLLSDGKVLDLGVIETKSFPKCKEFRVRFLHDPDARGVPSSLIFETENMTADGAWTDHQSWTLAKVVSSVRSL